MATPSGDNNMRKRKNIRELSNAYYIPGSGLHKEALNYLSAWHHIMVELKPTDPNSFFMIAGYHGMPFRGAGWGNTQWWGGYCHHGNVLFPTWHRAYCLRIEDALRSAPNGEDVALCYWNEIEEENEKEGLPKIFFEPKVTIPTTEHPDGTEVDNPLHHYKFQKGVWDNLPINPINPVDYSKSAAYDTVRFPFSGLQNQPKETQDEVDAYNQFLNDQAKQDPKFIPQAFNDRLRQWLNHKTGDAKGNVPVVSLKEKWLRCLETEEYTHFSNTTSATQLNQENLNVKKPDGISLKAIISLESPHNDGHLMVGGINVPPSDHNPPGIFKSANGDMGENDTAAFDPIFFHHHCFVDLMFHEWQLKHGKTEDFDIIPEYPGTNSVDSQGPTPGVVGSTWLTMDTALAPFKRRDNRGEYMTSRDVIDIEKLHYLYEDFSVPKAAFNKSPSHLIRAVGVNKAQINGSFIIASYLKYPKNKGWELLGYESVLSRWHTEGCGNCQLRSAVKSIIPIYLDKHQSRNLSIEDNAKDEGEDKYTIQTFVWTHKNLQEFPEMPPIALLPGNRVSLQKIISAGNLQT